MEGPGKNGCSSGRLRTFVGLTERFDESIAHAGLVLRHPRPGDGGEQIAARGYRPD